MSPTSQFLLPSPAILHHLHSRQRQGRRAAGSGTRTPLSRSAPASTARARPGAGATAANARLSVTTGAAMSFGGSGDLLGLSPTSLSARKGRSAAAAEVAEASSAAVARGYGGREKPVLLLQSDGASLSWLCCPLSASKDSFRFVLRVLSPRAKRCL